jgi:threonyl-tRNA synthetase
MAQAVLEMIPEGKVTIGPPVENGFYYDFDLPRNLTPEDLQQIEKRMRQIIAGKHEFKKTVVSAEEARQIFRDLEATGYSFFLHPETDQIVSVAPFNNPPNQYRITIDGEPKWFAQ